MISRIINALYLRQNGAYSTRIHRPLSFHRDSARIGRVVILLGIIGGTGYALTDSNIHLDSRSFEKHEAKSQESPTSGMAVRTSEKSLAHSRPNIDQILRRHEQTCIPNRSSGLARYDTVQFSSNNPTEDDHAEAILPVPSGYWSFFAVMDGHSGWETSAWLRENLIIATAGALADAYAQHLSTNAPSSPVGIPSEGVIEQTIKDTFRRLDDDIVRAPLEQVFSSNSRHAAVNLLAPAYAGSCALLAFYDSPSRVLRIALTGDSRAVLGRRTTDKNGNAVYAVHVLSVEQDGHNPAEEYRLNAQHPGEAVVKNGRVLGMGPSRAFGDAMYKWSTDVQQRLKKSYLGRSLRPFVKTPPYLTAEPEVTMVQVEPGDFLIMGTDGLWECLTSAEAVGLVGSWLDKNKISADMRPSTTDATTMALSDLPVDRNEDSEDTSVRFRQWGAKKEFVNADKNAATHLLRNALGGSDVDLISALLSMRSPRARSYIDDITTTVVFFT